MAVATNAPISPEEYLERERKAEFRSEYFRGQVMAKAGGSRRHGRIVTNLIRELGQKLRTFVCNVYASDLRVSVSRAKLYAYPDIVVTCGEEKFLDATFDTLLNPALIIEVLSESTKNYDRGQKFAGYRQSESLTEYVLVAQDKMQPSSLMSLAAIGVELRVSDVYEKVEFEQK